MSSKFKIFFVVFAALFLFSGVNPAVGMSKTRAAGNQKKFLSAGEVEKTLKALGVMHGNLTYVKSSDTTDSAWRSHLFNVQTEGLLLPLLVYVNDRDIIAGLLIRNGKVIAPQKSLVVKNQPEAATDMTKIASDNRMSYNASGRETIYMFSDPDCPYCQQQAQKLAGYKGKYRVVVKNFPLEWLHPGSTDKAIAQQCRWINKDCDGSSLELAKKIVNEDINDGQRLGISGTPFFIAADGKVLNGVPDLK